MEKKRYYYVLEFQYLGFRYHGWQKQDGVKTVQGMLNRTINYVLDGANFRTISAGRTDAMVSVEKSIFELFTFEPLHTDVFFDRLNENLPSDIRALSIQEVNKEFNIIQTPKEKEYNYFFTLESKIHPFAAPFLVYFHDQLHIDLMKEAALIFQGDHNFEQYCYKPKEGTKFMRSVSLCEIVENDILKANFFPEKSFILRVKVQGFMRHQIRLMMGALVKVGRGDLSIEDLQKTLFGAEGERPDYYIAPASGLILKDVVSEGLTAKSSSRS